MILSSVHCSSISLHSYAASFSITIFACILVWTKLRVVEAPMALSGIRMVLLSLLVVVAVLAVPAARAADVQWTNDGHHRRAAPVTAAPPSSSGPGTTAGPAPAPSARGGATTPSSGTSAPGTESPAPSPAAEGKNAAAAFSPLAWPALLVCAAGVVMF